MQSPVLTLLCLYGVGVSLVRADFLTACPPSCTCKWSSGLRQADCSNKDFTTIPNFHTSAGGSDQTVQVLLMDGNYIKELPRNIFYTAGLNDVQKISLSNCQIEKIHSEAFSKLNILTDLNLEGNQISNLEPKTFDGNNRLEKLVLSKNNIPLLEDYQFPQLRNLKKLDVSKNGLEEVRATAFSYLPNVEDIDLSGNRLRMLDHKAFLSLKKLKTLSLNDNLWLCDCQLKSFREFTVQKALNTNVPKCSEPERLAGKPWDKTSSLEFACKPDIKVQSEMVYAESGWNMTLSCHITGNPVPSMRWVLNGRVIHGNTTRLNHPGHQYHVSDIALGPGGIERNFSLGIDNVQWDDQGDYNCVAINQGGMAEKNITLTFSHPTTWADISDPSSLQFILALAGSFLLFIIIVIIFCCFCRRGRNAKKKDMTQNENLMSSYSDPAGEKLLPNQTTRFEDGEGMSMTNSADSYNISGAYPAPDLIQTRMTALSPGAESLYSTGGNQHLPLLTGGGVQHLPPLPGHHPHHMMHHSQEFLNPVHLMPVQRMHHMHHDPTPSPFHRTATLPHNYTISAGTLPHPHHHGQHGGGANQARSVSYDHSNGPAAARPGYVTLPRRPRASVAGYGVVSRDGAPSPAFSYGGTAEFRDPIYDGVGPRTSADGSSKLSLNQSGGDGTPRGHSTVSRPPGSISYALPPPIDEAPEIRPKPNQDKTVAMSTTTSQQTLIDGLEENLAAYDEPWGTAVAPSQSENLESSHSSSTLEDTAKLHPNHKDHEDPVMCSTPKSLGGGGEEDSIRDLPPPPSSVMLPPKTKPKTWKKPPPVAAKPTLSPTNEQPVDFSQQPLLDPNQQLSVCTTYSPNMSSAEVSPRHQLLSPNDSVTSSLLSADQSPRGLSDNVPIWTGQQQRKVGKVRPQPPPKPKMSNSSGSNAQQPKDSESITNSFQDETNDGSEV